MPSIFLIVTSSNMAGLLGCDLDVLDPTTARRYRLNPGVEPVEEDGS